MTMFGNDFVKCVKNKKGENFKIINDQQQGQKQKK